MVVELLDVVVDVVDVVVDVGDGVVGAGVEVIGACVVDVGGSSSQQAQFETSGEWGKNWGHPPVAFVVSAFL